MSSVRITDPVVLGRISGHFGVKGWLKIDSYTRPNDQLFQYDKWYLDCLGDGESWNKVEVLEFRQNPKGYIVKLAGYNSREASEVLVGCEIGIEKSRLEPLPEGEYYWLDLIGLKVINLEGVVLGKIGHLLETGANDVLVVHLETAQGEPVERLMPWTPEVVTRVDLGEGVMTVDWKEDY